ncbi:MAG TPA: family 16 glycosylhydrolase [Acidimicrobiales bacterium]|nr:family 16 glycosylhydrolase [Acidimicrobiales bacterium]
MASSYIFSDEFVGSAGSAPDPSKWYVMNGTQINGNTCSSANVFLDGNGHLVVRASRSGSAFTAGFLGTFNYSGWPPSGVKETFSLPFKVEASMLMPSTPGAWAALWAMNTDRPTSQDIYELDMAEERLTQPTVAGTHQHTWLNGVDQAPADATKSGVSDMTKNWHTYSCEVYSNVVQSYIDGAPIGTGFYGVSGSFGLLLNNGIGNSGSWGADGGQPASTDPGPWDLLVDYVHVTAL